MSVITRAERIQAFLFLLIGLVVTASVVLTLFGLRFTEDKRVYYLRFTDSVAGLSPGRPVFYKGVRYGRVGDIEVMPDDPKVVRVTLELEPSAPIRLSTTAVISTDSILGPYHIELRGSRATNPKLPPESFIPASATTLSRLVATGETLTGQFVEVLANLKEWTSEEHERSFWATVREARESLSVARSTITELKPDAQRLLKTYGDLGDQLVRFMDANAPVAEELLKDLGESARRVRTIVEQGAIEESVDSLKSALAQAVTELEKDGAAVRNWLEKHHVTPFIERAVSSLEKIESSVVSAGRTLEADSSAILRSEIAPTLRDLRIMTASLTKLLEALERQPGALIFGKPPAEKPLPGGRR